MTTGTGPVVRKSAVAAVFLLSLLWALDGLGPDLLPALRHSQMPGMERRQLPMGWLLSWLRDMPGNDIPDGRPCGARLTGRASDCCFLSFR